MLTQTKIPTIQLSSDAANAVRDILSERNLEGYALRVFVAGGSCCGVQYGMALDNIIRDNDMTFESEGIKLIVDDMSLDYLRGAQIEFVNDPQRGAGFAVNSPMQKDKSSCACGGGSCGGGACNCGNH